MSSLLPRTGRQSPVGNEPAEQDVAGVFGTGSDPQLALVLGGGNALGAYLAGASEHLEMQGIRPDGVVGASIGAVTAAILVGNPPERRTQRLREFWDTAVQHTVPSWAPVWDGKWRQIYNGAHAALAVMAGRPGLFRHRYPGLWSIFPGMPNDVALFDHSPLRHTLERLVDFDRLNRAETRLTIACVDLETGAEVYFDNRRDEIRPEHVLASAAIGPLFPPVEVGGRLLADPGYVNNLPLDPVFEEAPTRDLVCIAVDLFSLEAPRPASLDAILERSQDMVFASSGRRSIRALHREYALREQLEPDGPSVKLVHFAYQPPSHELAAKTLDYSPSSIGDRWTAGQRDMAAALAMLERNGAGRGRFEYLGLDPARSDGAQAGVIPAAA